VADAEERAISPVEDQLTDARVLEEHPLLSGTQVERHHVAQSVVVAGVEQGPGVRIIGQRGDPVEHRSFDVHQPPHLAGAGVERADVFHHPGVAKPSVEQTGGFLEEGTRHRTQCPRHQVAVGRDGLLANLGEVALLEFVLELDPLAPSPVETQAEDVLELIGVVGVAPLVALQPGNHLLRAMHEC